MFDQSTKTFHCNNCGKQITTGEEVWIKWQFPPPAKDFQDKAIKALEYQNAPILCLNCAQQIMNKSF